MYILIILFYGLLILLVLTALIYLIAKRLEDKKHESFERRDN